MSAMVSMSRSQLRCLTVGLTCKMAATDADAFVLLACLEPWLSALHLLRPPNGDIPLRHTDANGFRIVWFSGYDLFQEAAPHESLDRVGEALRLLDLIARANGELWKKVVLEIWTEDEGLRKWLEEEQLPKTFGVGLGLSDLRFEITRRAMNQLSGVDQDAAVGPSSEYMELLGFLKNELSIQCDGNDTSSIVRVCIEVDGTCGRIGDNDNEMLECVLNNVRTQVPLKNEREHSVLVRRETTEARPRLAVTNVDLTTGTRVDMDGLRTLHELARLGIALSHLPVLAMQPSDEELPEFVQAIRDLVGLDDDRIAGVSTICIDDHYSSWPVIRAVLTAAQHSSTARNIELDVGENQGDPRFREFMARNNDSDDEEDDDDGSEDEEVDNTRAAADEDEQAEKAEEDNDDDHDVSEDDADDDGVEEDEEGEEEEDYLDELDRLNDQGFDRSELWQWIAFTLFSRHADHNIETLELDSETLQASEVEAIRRVMNAPNPYAVVRGRPGVLPRRFVPRQITAARFVLQDPADDDVGPPFVAKNPIAVRVLETPDKGVFPWYQVLLPGYGDAFVHEDDVISKSEDNLPLHNRQASLLPEFSRIDIVNMTDDSMDPVADLIGLIGHETRRITYMEHLGDRGFEDWCAHVSKSCPKLEEFHMDGGFVDDLNAFESSARAGHCRLRELSVSCAPTGDKAQNVQRLFDALSDPGHPLTEHLRKLRVGLIVEAEDPKDVVDPVLRMLKENRRLVDITLVLRFTEAVEALRPQFESALDDRPRYTCVIRVAPLQLRCKLAFLSAVLDDEARVDGSIRSHLDSSVLGIVLQFAAEGRARTCTVFYEEFPRRIF